MSKPMACYEQSPVDPLADKKAGIGARFSRVRCNRIAGHDGPHRKLDPYDFSVKVEWDNGRYTIEPKVGAGA